MWVEHGGESFHSWEVPGGYVPSMGDVGALSLVSRVVKLAGITSRGWRSGRCGTAGLSCRSVARLLRLRSMRQGLPHFVRFRVAAALALGSVGQPRPSRAQLAACSACVRHSLQRLK